MKKILVTILAIFGAMFILQLAFGLFIQKTDTVYACKADEPITSCRNFSADIVHDPMDGSYVKVMYDRDKKITMEPVSHTDSYEPGCWLGHKTGVNNLPYISCSSSDGDWIILEGPKKTYER